MLSQCYRPLEVTSSTSHDIFTDKDFQCSLKAGVLNSKGIVGSAYIEFGGSKVMCSILCPRSVTKQSTSFSSLDSGSLECDIHFASHVVQPGVEEDAARFIEEEKVSNWVQSMLQSTVLLKFYPKQLITVSVTILQSSKYDMSAIVNCTTLALADASIHMRDLTCSHTIFLTKQDADKTVHNMREDAQFTVAQLPALCVTSNTHMEGRWSRELVQAADKQLTDMCGKIRELMASKLKK